MKRLLARGLFFLTSVLFLNSGAAEAATANITPSSTVTFANTVLGQLSATTVLTITRVAPVLPDLTANVAFSSISLSDSANFAITGGTCTSSTTLTAGTPSCTIIARFNPVTSGVHTATIDVGSNAVNGPLSIALSGNGVDSVVEFSSPTYQVSESGTSVTLTLTRTGNTTIPVDIPFTLVPNTANGPGVSPNDFDVSTTPVSPAPVSFLAAQISQTIVIPINTDTDIESNETFNVILGVPSNASAVIGENDNAEVTIVDDDGAATIEFLNPQYTISEGIPGSLVQVIRSGNTSNTVSVDIFPASDVTATYDATLTTGDYNTVPSLDPVGAGATITFNPGETIKFILVSLNDDSLIEGTETFVLSLNPSTLPAGVFPGINILTQVDIIDNDGPVSVAFSQPTYTFSEGQGTVNVVLTRTGDPSLAFDVDFTETDISADADGTDTGAFTPAVTVLFAGGEITQTISFTITDDTIDEDLESFQLDLSGPTNGVVLGSTTSTQVDIVDNDGGPGVFDISPAVVSANESGADVVLTINRTGGSSGSIDVPFSLLHGTTDASDITNVTGSPITFADGQTSASITIDLDDDSTIENSEFFTVVLGAPTAGVLGANTSSKVFIEDNETPPNPGVIQFSQPVYSFNEESSNVQATVYVTRTGGSDGAVSANYVVNSGTAINSIDFDNFVPTGPATISFGPGSTTPQTITFDILADNEVELTESFNLILEQPAGGATLGDISTATINIIDHDAPANPGRIEFSQPVYDITEGVASVTVYAVRLDGSDGKVDFSVLTANGTALDGFDYDGRDAGDPDITFTDGDVTPKPISIGILPDTLVEPTEVFSVIFSTPNGGGVNSLNGATLGSAALVNIVDEDNPGVIQFAQPVYSFSEGVGTADISVTRTGGSNGAVSVDCGTSNGSATSADYSPTTQTLTWGNGVTGIQNCSVAITNDANPESTEDFSAHISNITGGAIMGPITSAQVLIEDNDSTPNPGIVEFSQPTFTFNETDANFNATVYAIRRDGSEGSVTANVTFVDGTAIGGGTDFTPITASVTWGNGVTAPQAISFTVIGDTFQEAVESFNIILSGPTNGAVLGPNNNTEVRLLDDDGTGVIEFGTSSYTFDESAGTVTIVVNRNGGIDPTGVSFTVTPGTATGGGTDFNVTTASPLTFGTGVTVQTISIDINNDVIDESNEQFTISLNGPTNGAVVGPNGTATITINDNDGAGELQFDRADYSTLEDNAGIALQVRRVGGSDGAVSVDFSLSENSALTPEDFGAPAPATTLNWADGDSAPKSIVIPIVADLLVEGDEVFNAFLSGPTGGASLGSPDSATVTIVDDESPGKFSFSSAVYGVEEAEGTVTLSVLRRGGSKGEVTVDFETVSGTATSPTDYETRTGTLTWPDGDASPRLISVPIHDTDNEKTRTFTMVLSNPTGEASLEDPSVATVNIGFGIPSVPNSTDGGGCALTPSSSQSDSAPAWLLLAGLLSLAFFRTRGRVLRTAAMVALSSVFLMAGGSTGCNKRPPVPAEAVDALQRLVTEAQSFLNSFTDVASCEGLNKAVDDLNADQVIPCDTGETQASALVTQCNDGPFSGTATVVGVAQNCVDTSDGTTLDGTVTYTIHTDGTQDVTFSSAGATVNGINYPVGGVTVTTSGGATTCEGVLTVLDLPCTVTPDCSTCEFLQ